MERKTFITRAGILLAGVPFESFGEFPQPLNDISVLHPFRDKDPEELIRDEKYWASVRGMFNYPKDFTNLENGYFSPQPLSTEQFHQSREHSINRQTSWFMRKEQNEAIENTRVNLARFLNTDPEELCITRNTTESLNTIISGYPWKKGDEVILGNQDYGSMVAAFEQQVMRSGIVLKIAQVPLHPKNDEEIMDAYLSLLTAKTKIIHLTHLINLSGQILPARKIIDAAHARGVEVIVDAAHSIAHVDFKPGELNADYLGASLHKWLCCPLGVGILMVRKKHISKIWPLMADNEFPIDNIRKLQHQGTRPVQTLLTIDEAIRFHEAIGSRLKEQRLHYLKERWTSAVKLLPKVVIHTPLDANRSCAIANFLVEGYTPQQLADKLWSDHKIFTVAIDHPHIKGVRVTPHLYNTPEDLDKLVSAIKSIAS